MVIESKDGNLICRDGSCGGHTAFGAGVAVTIVHTPNVRMDGSGVKVGGADVIVAGTVALAARVAVGEGVRMGVSSGMSRVLTAGEHAEVTRNNILNKKVGFIPILPSYFPPFTNRQPSTGGHSLIHAANASKSALAFCDSLSAWPQSTREEPH